MKPKRCGRCNRPDEVRRAKELTKAETKMTTIRMMWPGEYICEECGFIMDSEGKKV